MLYIDGNENLDLALKYAQSAKAAMPNAPQIDDTLGLVYLKKGLTDLAIASFKSAVTADQKNGEYVYHLGMGYEQKEDKRQARAMFERALALSPDFQGAADARVRLAASR
jgi:Flp pilus assembly protein TadD